jgi:Na+/H+ antiporter NhaD/arsenite permease-like protein
MIIGHMSRMPFLRFSASMLPVALAALAIEYLVLQLAFAGVLKKTVIQRPQRESAPLDRRLLIWTCIVLALVFAGFLAGLDLSWTALSGGAVLMVVARRDTHEVLKLVDFHLLVFFAALFVVVEGLNGTGLPAQIYQRLHDFFGASSARQAWSFAFLSVLGSNVFSNVPFVLVAGKWVANFAQPELMWKVMALSTTFAGNLTILGSVANIIVVESARSKVEVGFWDYARVGIPVTILTTIIGMGILLVIG